MPVRRPAAPAAPAAEPATKASAASNTPSSHISHSSTRTSPIDDSWTELLDSTRSAPRQRGSSAPRSLPPARPAPQPPARPTGAPPPFPRPAPPVVPAPAAPAVVEAAAQATPGPPAPWDTEPGVPAFSAPSLPAVSAPFLPPLTPAPLDPGPLPETAAYATVPPGSSLPTSAIPQLRPRLGGLYAVGGALVAVGLMAGGWLILRSMTAAPSASQSMLNTPKPAAPAAPPRPVVKPPAEVQEAPPVAKALSPALQRRAREFERLGCKDPPKTQRLLAQQQEEGVKSAELSQALGSCALRQRLPGEAADHFRAALALRPDYEPARKGLARAEKAEKKKARPKAARSHRKGSRASRRGAG